MQYKKTLLRSEPWLLAFLLLILPVPLQAASIALTPTADAFVSAANPSSNYGGAGALSIAAGGLQKGEFQTVMQFDTSSAKALFDSTYGAGSWTIQSVALEVTAASPGNPIFNASAAGNFTVSWMNNSAWAEGTGMPNAPTTDGITFNSLLASYESSADQTVGTYTFAGGTSGAATYVLGLPSGLTSDLASGSVVGFRLFAADANVSYLFNSRSFVTASSRPQLTITAVPEPASLAIFFIAATGLLMRRIHR